MHGRCARPDGAENHGFNLDGNHRPNLDGGQRNVRTADRLAEGAGVWDLDDRRLSPTPAPQLNGVGEVLLLGLAVLTVRSRVKH